MDDIRKTAEETTDRELAELPQEITGEQRTAEEKEEVRKEMTEQPTAQNKTMSEEERAMREGAEQQKEPALQEEAVKQEAEVQREVSMPKEAGAEDEADMQLEAASQEEDVPRKHSRKSGHFKSNPAGYLMLACAFFLLFLAGWMRLNIAGTRLLYIDLWTGRICRYYWIPLTAAVIMAAVGGFWLLKSKKNCRG